MSTTATTLKKGINFKQTPSKKLLVVHPETFAEYLATLPKNERGWVAFDFTLFPKLTKNNYFANISPTQQKEQSA